MIVWKFWCEFVEIFSIFYVGVVYFVLLLVEVSLTELWVHRFWKFCTLCPNSVDITVIFCCFLSRVSFLCLELHIFLTNFCCVVKCHFVSCLYLVSLEISCSGPVLFYFLSLFRDIVSCCIFLYFLGSCTCMRSFVDLGISPFFR
jgi:hypothetical protein